MRHFLRKLPDSGWAVLAVLAGVLLTQAAAAHCEEGLFLSGGLDASRNLGVRVGPVLMGQVERGPIRAEAAWSLAPKIESEGERGWSLGFDVDAMLPGTVRPFAGVGYTMREAAGWTKRSTWARAGVVYGRMTILAAHGFGTANDPWLLEWRGRIALPDGFYVEPRAGWEHYRASAGGPWHDGIYCTLLLGISFPRGL